MLIWAVPCLMLTGLVWLLDFLLRRKRWSRNTKKEKTGLILTLAVSFPYLILSAYGMLLGIVAPGSGSAWIRTLNQIVLVAGQGIAVVSLLAIVASLVLRKVGKAGAANWSLLIGLIYGALVFGVSLLV